jgi:hypothetical protein
VNIILPLNIASSTSELKQHWSPDKFTYFFLHMVRVIVLTFNYILVTFIWQSVLLVKETGVPGENLCPAASH